jgi:hypothetical protein
MASRQFISTARRGRNRAPSRRRTRSIRPRRKGGDQEPAPTDFGSLRTRVENERGELLRATSVLRCLYSVLLDSGRDEDPTYYADVAEVVCRLVQDSVDRLDSVVIGAAVQVAIKPEGGRQKRSTDKAGVRRGSS